MSAKTKKKSCQCHFCKWQLPLFNKIKKRLAADTKTLEMFEDFADDLWHEAEESSTELGALQGKLKGFWPGFETYEQRLTLISKEDYKDEN